MVDSLELDKGKISSDGCEEMVNVEGHLGQVAAKHPPSFLVPFLHDEIAEFEQGGASLRGFENLDAVVDAGS